jgi:hypothetical protein
MTEPLQEKKVLPTDRINVSKQMDILRAYGAHYEATNTPVKNEDIARIVRLSAATISLSNAFFNGTKLIQRIESGGYTPCLEVVAFCRAYQWDSEKAPQKLAPAIERTWFAKALLPKLKFSPLEEKEAVQHLGEETATGKEVEPQLKMLVEFLVMVGLVARDGSQLRLVQQEPKKPEDEGKGGGNKDDGKRGDKDLDLATLKPHTLPLKNSRKIVVYAPASISQAELKRLQDWLALQLLIADETQGETHD